MAAPTPETATLWQTIAPLIPVVVGGLIGIVGGLAGTAFGHTLRTRTDKKALQRTKLELLVGHLAEIEHWGNKTRHFFLHEEGERVYEPHPAAKVLALATIYFPTLHEAARALDLACDKYELALMEQRGKLLEAAQKALAATAAKREKENPGDPHNVEWAKIAATEAKLEVGKGFNLVQAYQPVIDAKRIVADAAKALAATL